MTPLDEDILITHYADDPIGAAWYHAWRKLGLEPREAIRAVDTLRQEIGLIEFDPFPSPAQVEALHAFAAACEQAVNVLRQLSDFAPLPINAPLAAERIQQSAREARTASETIKKQLLH